MKYSVSARSLALLCALGSALIATAPSNAAVLNPNAPTISGVAPTAVNVGSAYTFTPTAADPHRWSLFFYVQNLPRWAKFNTATGTISGTPGAADVGTYPNVQISVTDNGQLRVALPAFTVAVKQVAAGNVPNPNAPTISGVAATAVNAGSAYTFTPTAADPNRWSLYFYVQNLPHWASFNTATGTISGTPGAADVGTYANIQISVTDNGQLRVALPAFTVAVNQMSAGNASLDWTAPTDNTDGSILTNLGGYIVHYGNTPGQLTQVIRVANPGLATYVVENLSSGTWYFTVTSYATDGTESANSAEVTKTIG
jgi:citrate lyase gamma subunit